jgi:hypothetical protein
MTADDKQPRAASEPTPADIEAEGDESYEYLVGDKIHIPTHNGNYVAHVVHRYPSLEAATKAYKGSFQTILQSPYGKATPDQPFYYCEVANATRKPLGVAQEHASLKWREESAAAE